MDGELNGNILRSSDGYVYYRHGPDGKKSKLYFRFDKYRRGGCPFIIQTDYTHKAVNHLRGFNKNGPHSHNPSHDSHKRVQMISNISAN